MSQIVRDCPGFVAGIEHHLDFRFTRLGITTPILGAAIGFLAVVQRLPRARLGTHQ
jgi:hypothetical protein